MQQRSTTRAREKYRETTPPGYSHIKHFIKLISMTVIPSALFLALLFNVSITLMSLLMIPIGIVIANFIEYVTHRWPMHRTMFKGYMYHRHAGVHHAMFKHDSMEMTDKRDWYHVMMPVSSGVAFMMIVTSLTIAAYTLISPAAACVMGITLCMYILSEELLHLSFHLPSTWLKENMYTKTLARLGEHHRAHHNSRYMRHYAFNIAIPLFDSVFKTRPPQN